MALHREDVVRTAVELLDEVGLDRLTTRALTTRLGVQPGALYWHVRSKRELLTAIADEIMREAFTEPAPPAGQDRRAADWAGRTAEFAHRMRRAMLAHRDGARLVAGHMSMNATTLAASEQGLALMRAAGLSLARAAYFGNTVTSYVTGYVLQEQAAPSPGSAASGPPDPALDAYPNLLEWQARRPADPDLAFTAGLSLIIQGLRSELAAEELAAEQDN